MHHIMNIHTHKQPDRDHERVFRLDGVFVCAFDFYMLIFKSLENVILENFMIWNKRKLKLEE